MTVSPLQGITHACFGLSYLLAFGLELARPAWPAAGWRAAALTAGAAGFVAHTLYLFIHHPTPAAPYGSLLWLAWVLALFYLGGTVRHAEQAWAVFVLPVVIGLVGLSLALTALSPDLPAFDLPGWLAGDRFWGVVHGSLILLAAIGVSVAFLASVMYLAQARRVRHKVNPARVVPLLSLERLETMNRRAVNLAFPLLTAGLLVGSFLLRHDHDVDSWLSLKVLSTGGLWVVFLVLLYLRYAADVSGRRLAWLSIAAFGLLLVALGAAHPFVQVRSAEFGIRIEDQAGRPGLDRDSAFRIPHSAIPGGRA
ncbi:MAG: cytochrome c biogenesis protein [Gemmataceae bacterium]|nr:cytochrome c biogenesis protein [Gemmataceae bacterium]